MRYTPGASGICARVSSAVPSPRADGAPRADNRDDDNDREDGDAQRDVCAAMQERQDAVEVRAERIAQKNQGAAENERTEKRPQIEQRDVHLRDSCGECRYASQYRQEAADEDREPPPAFEKAMNQLKPLVRNVHVTSVALDERHAPVTAYRVANRTPGQLADQCDGDREPQVAQVPGRHERARRGQDELRADRRAEITERKADE